MKQRIFYFARRFAMDIDHLGTALVDQLVDARHRATTWPTSTRSRPSSIAELERMGEKSAKNVVASIQRSQASARSTASSAASGIPQIGQVAARQLAEEAGTLERCSRGRSREAREHVDAIRGFGPQDGRQRRRVPSRRPEQRALMEKLVALGVGAPAAARRGRARGPLMGMIFCVTGVLSRKREDVHADIRAAGGEVHDGVKKNTTYLVAGDKTGKSKLDQAKKFGTKVITEKQMEALLRGEAIGAGALG